MKLSLPCALVCLGLHETFDGIGLGLARLRVDCAVDHAVTANAENFDELEGAIIDERAKRGWGRSIGF